MCFRNICLVAGLALGLTGATAIGADLTVQINGPEKITYVGAFQRWDPDGNPTPSCQFESEDRAT